MTEERQKISISTSSWVKGVVVLGLAYAVYQVHEVALGLIASIVIASAIEPITQWAKRENIPRLPAVVAIYGLTVLFFSAFFYFLLLPLIGEISGFVKTLTIYSNSVVNDSILSGMFQSQNVFAGLDRPVIFNELSTYLNNFSDFLSQGIFSSLAKVFGGVVSFVLIIVLSFYLAVQEDGIAKFLEIVSPSKHEAYITRLWRRSQMKIGRWMQGQLLLGALVMILVYIGLIIFRVPHALLLAVLAGILELIPLFGPVIAAIPAVFIAYAEMGPTKAIIVTAIYVVIQQFENHIIYPMVVKKVVGVPPMVSILALVIGGKLAGFLGILIAVPVAAVIMEFVSDIEEEKFAKQIAAKN